MFGRHVNVSHDHTRRTVTIEMTEDAVIGCYISSCVFLIGGLIAGCTVYKKQQSKRNLDPCTCAECRGLYQFRREIGTGGYGSANLVVRQGRPYVLKKVGCDSINEANAALAEAACLQRLNHPNVVRFEDVFLHRHDNGGCSVSIVMEFLSGGDLTDRLECRLGEKPLSELAMVRFLHSLCHALHHVHCNGVLHRDLKSSNIFVSRNDREVKVRPRLKSAAAELRRPTLTSSKCGSRLSPTAAGRFWAGGERALPPPPRGLATAHVALRHRHVHVTGGRRPEAVRRALGHLWPGLCAARDDGAPTGVRPPPTARAPAARTHHTRAARRAKHSIACVL